MIRKGSPLYKAMALPGLALIAAFEALIVRTRGNATFYPADHDWCRYLEAHTEVIRGELQDLLRRTAEVPEFKDISEEQARITRGVWRTHIFYVYGQRLAANCAECPETARLLQTIPGMTTGMFSMLTPGTRLTPHRGPFKGVLRYHLGLIIPKDPTSCGIRVGSETRHWRQGESMIFDDTHDHEAWNNSEELRVVLFVDFIRDLPFPLNVLNRGMIWLIGASPFVRNMVTNLNKLNNRVSDVDPA